MLSTTSFSAHVATQEITEALVQWTPKIGLSCLVLFVFYLAAALLSRFFRRISLTLPPPKRVIVDMLIKVGKTALLLFGAASALGTLGVNVSALVAGLGLTGFALGFALRDMLSNIVSGTMILIYQPFRVDDHIMTTGFEGRVKEIDLRYTVLEKKGGERIYIPNSNLMVNPIVIKSDTEEKT